MKAKNETINRRSQTMNVDPRCCGSGTCIINEDGECWCGQRWDGEKMCQPYFVNESGLKINAVTGSQIDD